MEQKKKYVTNWDVSREGKTGDTRGREQLSWQKAQKPGGSNQGETE
jgi:hypothetical protein